MPSVLDTDVIGWFKENSVIGVIRPLANLEPAEAATALAAAVQRAARTQPARRIRRHLFDSLGGLLGWQRWPSRGGVLE